jgi:signal transduction histidine kinase
MVNEAMRNRVRIRMSGTGTGSPLYRRLAFLRLALPVVAFALVLTQQIIEHTVLRSLGVFQHFTTQMLFYGILGPGLAWATLTWITRRVRERDEAESHLTALYEVGKQATATAEVGALMQLALQAPAQVLSNVSASIVARENIDGPWTLEGTTGLAADQIDNLNAYLVRAGGSLQCAGCTLDKDSPSGNCQLLSAAKVHGDSTATAICFPLSTDLPPQAVLTIHGASETSVNAAEHRALESMMAGLATGLDRARLRARSLEAIRLINAGSDTSGELGNAVAQILGDLAVAHQADAGAVYLSSAASDSHEIIPIAEWPTDRAAHDLTGPAQRALDHPSIPITQEIIDDAHLVALPLAMGELSLGVLVLRRHSPFTELHTQLLHIATSVLAAVVRNNQLNLQLEGQSVLAERNRIARELHDGLAQTLGFMNFKIQQINRTLERDEPANAQTQLQELLGEVQQLYADARLSVVDLRWSSEKRNLEESLLHTVNIFESRSGMIATFTGETAPALSARDEAHLLGIVHEALTNVQKHAGASHVWVTLRSTPDGASIEVEDDGQGLDNRTAADSGHFGMRIIKERAQDLGGTAEWSSGPNGGTLFRLNIPTPHPVAPGAEA